MDQTVNIPFSHKLDPGDSEFTIEILSRFRDNPNRLFGFSTVTLCPDYFSRKAYKLDMDSERELQAEVKNDFYYEVEYDNKVFDAKPWEHKSATTMGDLLKSINNHFQQNKPAGCMFPAVAFDWFDLLSLGKDVNAEEYHKSKANDYYGEPFDASKHLNWIPVDYRDKTTLNDMMFPTKPEAMASIRIRMTLSANVTVAFSNNELPQLLGISENQMPTKVNRQFPFKNPNANGFIFTRFLLAPTFNVATGLTTKIHAYPTSTFVVSNVGALKTTVDHERKPDIMAREYNNALRSLAFGYNLNVSLQHVVAEKKYKIIFPTASGIKVHLRVPAYIGHRLGYGHVDNITSTMTSGPYPKDDVEDDLLSRAQVLVYDAGMVVVSLDEIGSQQTHQFTNPCMAILEAHESGVMTTKQGVDMPRVPVSQFNKDIKFVLSRFNENNQPIPLGWKDGAYIRGVLVGKV
jgi:hypothetical protein